MVEDNAQKLIHECGEGQLSELLTQLIRAAYEKNVFTPPYGASQFVRKLEDEAIEVLPRIPLTGALIEDSGLPSRARNTLVKCLQGGAATVADVTDDLIMRQYNSGKLTLSQIVEWRRGFIGK